MAEATIRICEICGKPIAEGQLYHDAMECSLEKRFWAKVDKRGPDECWPWSGARLKTGYGVIGIVRNGKQRITTAHRVSLAIKLGRAVNEDFHACHTCDNVSCVNPAHLFEGTAKDNNVDKVEKGRQSKGDQHGRSRLSEAQARAILIDPRTHDAIAVEYGIARTAITRIKNGTRWKHLSQT